jgi:hypothetical protein
LFVPFTRKVYVPAGGSCTTPSALAADLVPVVVEPLELVGVLVLVGATKSSAANSRVKTP